MGLMRDIANHLVHAGGSGGDLTSVTVPPCVGKGASPPAGGGAGTAGAYDAAVLRALDSVPPDEAVGGDRFPAALARVADPGQLRPRLRPDIEIAHFTTRWGDQI